MKLKATTLLMMLLGFACFFLSPPPPSYAQNQKQQIVERFRKLDTNSDGKLSRQEMKNPKAFEKLDTDHDGFVTPEEIKSFFRQKMKERQNAKHVDYSTFPNPVMNKNLNIQYLNREGVDPNLLSLDIYSPKTGKNHRVMLMIHGGGWSKGDKSSKYVCEGKSRYFVSKGYVFVSINYRLSPKVKHPAHVEDVAAALAYIHNNIAKYGGNPDEIVIMGHSAGAHLAALVSVDERKLKNYGKNLDIIKGTILLDGAAYNLPRSMTMVGNKPFIKKMYETAFGTNEKGWKDASPVTFIKPGKQIPPFLIFRAGKRKGNKILTEELSNRLNKAGYKSRTVQAPNKNHGEVNSDVGVPGDIMTVEIMKFLNETVK